jgi:hypothetical protein
MARKRMYINYLIMICTINKLTSTLKRYVQLQGKFFKNNVHPNLDMCPILFFNIHHTSQLLSNQCETWIPSLNTAPANLMNNVKFLYLLIYSLEQSPSWVANQLPASQEFLHILWNSKVHYHIHSACHLSLSWVKSIPPMPPYPTSWR